MPKRKDIKKVMVIGSGPIVIGQAAEFDYAGTQACLALEEEGYEVILVNSNPATIMTDTHHRRQGLHGAPDAGVRRQDHPLRASGRHRSGTGRTDGPEPRRAAGQEGDSGRSARSRFWAPRSSRIERAEDRELFKELCESLGEPVIESQIAMSVEEAAEVAHRDRLSGGAASGLHAGRHGRRLRRRRSRAARADAQRTRRFLPCIRCSSKKASRVTRRSSSR